jgi:hypothetical protein
LSLISLVEWGILVGMLLVSSLVTYVAFEELPSEDDPGRGLVSVFETKK